MYRCPRNREVAYRVGQQNNNDANRKVASMLNRIRQFIKEDEGASAAEYALLLALVSLFIVGAVTLLGTNIAAAINAAAAVISS
jgi:pilus assembly protein Flp/PilA